VSFLTLQRAQDKLLLVIRHFNIDQRGAGSAAIKYGPVPAELTKRYWFNH